MSSTSEPGQDKTEGTVFDRPLGEGKAAPKGRFAELPYNMRVVAAAAGYSQIEDKRKQFLPILRHGVVRSQYSFVHCMERATNAKYDSMSIEKKNKHIKDVLKKIAGLPHFAVGRQEMYDIADEEIREHLVSDGAYIDPDMYISIFESYYNHNIILFQIDSESLGGELVIPRHNIAYLDRKLNKSKKTIIIVKFEIQDDWEFQCELVAKYVDGKFEFSFDTSDKFIELISKIKEKVNTVYFTSAESKYKKYIPAIEI